MSGKDSRSTKSDRISESSIARIAGNIMSGAVCNTRLESIGARGDDITEHERWTVAGAVKLARAITAEIGRTEPVRVAPVPDVTPVDTRVFAQCPACRWKWIEGALEKHSPSCVRGIETEPSNV